jgi:hypothetical protein
LDFDAAPLGNASVPNQGLTNVGALLRNGAAVVAGGPTGQGRAVSLPLVSSVIELNSSGINVIASAGWTMSAWIRLLRPASGNRTLFCGPNFDQTIFFDLNSTMLGAFSFSRSQFVSSGASVPSLPDNMWHHFAAVGRGSTTRFFVNGVLVGSASFATDTKVKSIGNALGSEMLFANLIDEVYIWPRNLSNTQISEIYTATQCRAGQQWQTTQTTVEPTTVTTSTTAATTTPIATTTTTIIAPQPRPTRSTAVFCGSPGSALVISEASMLSSISGLNCTHLFGSLTLRNLALDSRALAAALATLRFITGTLSLINCTNLFPTDFRALEQVYNTDSVLAGPSPIAIFLTDNMFTIPEMQFDSTALALWASKTTGLIALTSHTVCVNSTLPFTRFLRQYQVELPADRCSSCPFTRVGSLCTNNPALLATTCLRSFVVLSLSDLATVPLGCHTIISLSLLVAIPEELLAVSVG